jgi:hypothetical protein
LYFEIQVNAGDRHGADVVDAANAHKRKTAVQEERIEISTFVTPT